MGGVAIRGLNGNGKNTIKIKFLKTSNWLCSTIHELGIIPSSNRREFQRAVQSGKLNRQKGDKCDNKMAFFFPKKNGLHPQCHNLYRFCCYCLFRKVSQGLSLTLGFSLFSVRLNLMTAISEGKTTVVKRSFTCCPLFD